MTKNLPAKVRRIFVDDAFLIFKKCETNFLFGLIFKRVDLHSQILYFKKSVEYLSNFRRQILRHV